MTTRRNFIKGIAAMAGLALAGLSLESDSGRRYDTIAHSFLDVERGLGVVGSDYRTLDSIIDGAKDKVSKTRLDKPFTEYTEEEAIPVLETIDEIIKGRGFTYQENVLLNKGLKSKGIDCDNRSIIYLGIADVLKLPLKAVNTPLHVSIRWHFDEKNYFNWETTNAEKRSDERYKIWRKVPDKSIDKGAFLKSLNREETMSIAYKCRGYTLSNFGRNAEAVKSYNKAIKLNQNDPDNYVNKSAALYYLGEYKETIECSDKAIVLYPISFEAYYNRGLGLEGLKEYEEALESYDKSLEYKPGYEEALKGKRRVLNKIRRQNAR